MRYLISKDIEGVCSHAFVTVFMEEYRFASLFLVIFEYWQIQTQSFWFWISKNDSAETLLQSYFPEDCKY